MTEKSQKKLKMAKKSKFGSDKNTVLPMCQCGSSYLIPSL